MNGVKIQKNVDLAAAAALAAYWLYEERMRRSSTFERGWMQRMKRDVLVKLEDAKGLNRERYRDIVDQAAVPYQRSAGKTGGDELKGLVRGLKGNWDDFSRDLIGGRGCFHRH